MDVNEAIQLLEARKLEIKLGSSLGLKGAELKAWQDGFTSGSRHGLNIAIAVLRAADINRSKPQHEQAITSIPTGTTS